MDQQSNHRDRPITVKHNNQSQGAKLVISGVPTDCLDFGRVNTFSIELSKNELENLTRQCLKSHAPHFPIERPVGIKE